MTPGRARPQGTAPDGTPPERTQDARAAAPRRLSLGDPLDGRAAEDRPESWGDSGESESATLARYRTETPPHHGG